MPVYEYRCVNCRRKMAVFFRSVAVAVAPKCNRCGSERVQRLFSTFALRRAPSSGLDDVSDDAGLDELAESDPKAMARMMRKMGEEAGEDLGTDFNQMVDRLEAGESLDDLDQEMGGGEGDGSDGSDLDE